jgi:putative spermidine/putrescine transport system substrate-binding protein
VLSSLLASAGSASLGTITGAPYVRASEVLELRYLSSGVNVFPQIAEKALRDLGIKITYQTMPSDDILRMVITQPNDLDILELDYSILKQVFRMGRLQSVPASKIRYFDRISPVLSSGYFEGQQLSSQGAAPFEVGFTDGAESTAVSGKVTDWMTAVPTVYNADTLGIRPDLIQRPVEHWRDLLDPEFKGKAALINIPSIGIIDAAMAIESAGEYRYPDKGNMSREEIDMTMEKLIDLKKKGHFAGLWNAFGESVELMASGRAVIQSMWSPAVTQVRQMGIPCVYQPLQEGYRGWCYGLGLSRSLTGKKRDAAYEFFNWFLSGWTGAFLQRQGYYPSVLDNARHYLSENEWGYWIEGKPAQRDIVAPDGSVVEPKGSVRDGGSYAQRMSRVACWNSIMDQSRYLLRRWKALENA